MKTETDPSTCVTAYSYRKLLNGTVYDDRNLVSEVKTKYGLNTTIADFGYTGYQDNGSLTEATDAFSIGQTAVNGTSSYGYDNRTQLNAESRTGGTAWSRAYHYDYDGAGNLDTLLAHPEQPPDTDPSVWTSALNRVSGVAWPDGPTWQVSHGYDVGQNHLDDGAVHAFQDSPAHHWDYSYDDENRLTLIQTGATPPYLTVYQCWYDAFGRPSKERYNDSDAQIRYLVWDGDELRYEVNSSGAVIVRYMWGPTGLLGYYNSDSAFATRIVLRDGLGHVRALMNTSRTLTDGYEYDAYGNDMNPALRPTTEGANLRFRWNGAYGYRTLPGTNVLHVGARHYSPQLRRWLQTDATDVDGGSGNLYVFADDDPVGCVDADGLQVGGKQQAADNRIRGACQGPAQRGSPRAVQHNGHGATPDELRQHHPRIPQCRGALRPAYRQNRAQALLGAGTGERSEA